MEDNKNIAKNNYVFYSLVFILCVAAIMTEFTKYTQGSVYFISVLVMLVLLFITGYLFYLRDYKI